ncbi:hypothetical protein V8G54_036326 [Vigna mungo]|uniref:Uncharacterized protein n=1 Tax=Vigna mungo TaxID=3915 RepID=A0AAQ3MGW5_VIGMU
MEKRELGVAGSSAAATRRRCGGVSRSCCAKKRTRGGNPCGGRRWDAVQNGKVAFPSRDGQRKRKGFHPAGDGSSDERRRWRHRRSRSPTVDVSGGGGATQPWQGQASTISLSKETLGSRVVEQEWGETSEPLMFRFGEKGLWAY